MQPSVSTACHCDHPVAGPVPTTEPVGDVSAEPDLAVLGEALQPEALAALDARVSSAVAYNRWHMEVVAFACADRTITPQQAALWNAGVNDVVAWGNRQFARAGTHLSLSQDGGALRVVRSDRPLAWFRAAHDEVLRWWAPYPQFATSGDVKAYREEPASRQRWWMNALCDLSRFRTVHLGGKSVVQAVQGDPGKAMGVHSRTVVLCTFACPSSTPGALDGGAVAPATTAMISPDSLLRTAGPPVATGVIAHEAFHTLGLPHPDWEKRQPEKVGGVDVDIMSAGTHMPVEKAVVSMVDLVRLRDRWASQYRSPRAVHTLTMGWLGHPMPDGDVVHLSGTAGACPPDRVRLTLELGSGITWWKGLHLFDRVTGSETVLAETQDAQGAKTAEIALAALRTNDFVLAKAKVFGVHTHMYCLQDADRVLRGGSAYTLRWAKD